MLQLSVDFIQKSLKLKIGLFADANEEIVHDPLGSGIAYPSSVARSVVGSDAKE